MKVYPATGTVKFDGKAAGPLQLVLEPETIEKKAPPAGGTVAADGTFKLTTYGNHDGVAEGKYTVLLSSDPMAMVPVPTTKPLTLENKRDGSGRIAPLNLELVSIKGAKPSIGAALPIGGGAVVPGGPMAPRAR